MTVQCPGYSTEFDPTVIFDRILVPIDFTPESRRALITACETRRRFGSEIRLCVICDTGDNSAFRAGLENPWIRQNIKQSVCDQLRELAESICSGRPCMSFEAAHSDDVVRGIADAVERCGATVVFLPYHPRKSVLRSRAEKIIRALDVPVFVLKDVQNAVQGQEEAPRPEREPLAEKPVILCPAGRLIANPRWPALSCQTCSSGE